MKRGTTDIILGRIERAKRYFLYKRYELRDRLRSVGLPERNETHRH